MIVRPPQQQVNSYHLAMAFLLLVLTVYPYLFNHNTCYSVSAYSSHDVDLKHHLIEKFDIIESNDIVWSRSILTRDTRKINEQLLHDQNYSYESNELDAISSKHLPTRKVQFSSLGRKFDLILSKPSHLITNDFTVVSVNGKGEETIVPINRDDIQILEGFVEGEPTRSSATASFDNRDKLMTAQIKTGQDTIIVEPSYLHKNSFFNPLINSSDPINPKLYNKTMIVYNLGDHKQFKGNEIDNSTLFNSSLCASVSMNDYSSKFSRPPVRPESYNPELDDVFKIYEPITNSNRKRVRRDLGPQDKERKTRCTLHLVADHLFYKNVGNGDLQTTINYLLALINRVNLIYLPTVWETGDNLTGNFSDIGFTVQNITIHQEFTRLSSGDNHYNMQGEKIWAAREFLDNFSKYSPPRHYCLAHLLTYRQFDSPVLGLAYVASTRYGTIGGICSPTQQKGDSFFKHNTGISTSKGISGETLITRQADLVVAHELGHNLGAEHDSNDCRPSPWKGGAYLMHPFAVMGFEKNNRFLSNCSRISIGRVIKRKASTCFVGVVDNVCGNGVVEEDEECDGGDVGHGHNDPCCDSSCRFTPGSQCSDRHSWCCSKCQVVPAGKPCRPAEEYNCKQAAYCDGSSSRCPDSPPVDDNTVCVGRGLCRGGDCIPFCEARELHSCLCHNPTDACKLCCKSSINGTCVPYDNRAPYLPDGLLCYRGVCRKGRCEQPVQDVVARLWGVIENFNFTILVKFLRDNIIFVVLVCSIPVWCIVSYYVNEFDLKIKQEMMNAIMNARRKNGPSNPSPFLPRLFVGDDIETSNPPDEGLPMNEIKLTWQIGLIIQMTVLRKMNNPWIFDQDHLDFTPSIKDGITKVQECNFRIDGARFIQRLGARELELHYCTVATGAVFFHRFYMFHSFRMFPVYPMAATCLFLAGKVEETPKKSNDIVKFSKSILSEQDFAQFGPDPKEEILTLERILLQTLRFDLEVEHPYDHLIKYVKHFEVARAGHKDETVHKELLQSAWTFLNDSCCTTVCLQYEPEIVAIAMLLLACKTGAFEIFDWDSRRPEQRYWWEVYVENLDELTLENICHQVLDVYQVSSITRRTDENPVSAVT